MEKFLKEVEEQGLGMDAVKGMVQRDIEYKEFIYKEIHNIKVRQKMSIILGTIIIVLMSIILYKVEQNVQSFDELIKALLYATGMIDKT